MELDHSACYEVVTRDDPQFDGHFFSAVLTTRIYCRPVCHARTPRPENVRFFATAAAASEAGFRPCLRCRPESAPDAPEWQGVSPAVSRALRLIAEGLLDEVGTDELARRVFMSPRQLRRQFVQELGAPPVAIAQTRRLLFAKKLIDETGLSMADVAFSAGFSSIRRFNDAIRQTYGRTPTELRRSRRKASSHPTTASTRLKLYYREPYNWPAMLSFLRATALPGMEFVDDQAYRRTVRINGTPGIIEVLPLPNERAVLLSVPFLFARQLLPITERVKRLFDLRADSAIIDGHLMTDPCLAELIHRHPGTRVPGAWDGYESAVRVILGERIGNPTAGQLAGRLVAAYGDRWRASTDAALTYMFPSAERLATASLDDIGVTPQQAESIRALSRAAADEALILSTASSLSAAIDQLLVLPGIDDDTAQHIAMRALNEPDALPAGDGRLRQALAMLTRTHGPEAALPDFTERWRPWRAYAAAALWNHLRRHT